MASSNGKVCIHLKYATQHSLMTIQAIPFIYDNQPRILAHSEKKSSKY